jgi:tetratricopeptide (TPR) repeat protein
MKRLFFMVCVLATARSAAAQGLSPDDLQQLRSALEIDPFAVAPYRLLTAGLPPAGRRKLTDVLAHKPDFANQVVAARLDADAGQVPVARTLLHSAGQHLPPEERTLDAFAQLALSVGAYAEVSLAMQAAFRTERTPQRLVTAAIAEMRQGKNKEGLALLAEARKKDPSGGAADSALDALLGQRLIAEAADLLRAELMPSGKPAATGDAATWRKLADLEHQLNHPEAETQALFQALDAETFATGRRATSQAILRSYRERKALPELQRALKNASTSPRLVLRGDVENELGHSSSAIESYLAAEKLAPNDPDPPLRLSGQAKTPAERARRYEALVAAHPNELRYVLELSDLRAAAKDEAGARAALHEAATRFDSAPTAQAEIARRLSAHGDKEGALAARRRAAALDTRNADYAIALGDAYHALGKRAEAVAAYGDAIARGDKGHAAYDRGIEALENAGYDTEADVRYNEARAKWPGDVQLLRRYAATLERRRDYKRAIGVWKEIENKSQRSFEKEQAAYSRRRLEDLALENGSAR